MIKEYIGIKYSFYVHTVYFLEIKRNFIFLCYDALCDSRIETTKEISNGGSK